MKKLTARAGARGLFVAALTTASLFCTASYAASDMDQVKAAVDAYHEALTALDVPKLEASWVHDQRVLDIEPASKAVTVGWDAVKKNIEGYFDAFSELKVTPLEPPYIQV